MFRFLHAADLHLDSPLLGLERYDGAPVERIRNAGRRALENLTALAIDRAVDFVLIAGDLYDGECKDYGTCLFLVSQMAKLREAGIPVFIVAGNHDAANRMTQTLRMPDNVRMLSHDRPQSIVLETCDAVVHGRSFARGAVTENLARGYPAADPGLFNIGLLHTSATGGEGHEPYAPCSLDDLRNKRYDYWALGHIHKAQTLATDPWIVFPGNTQGRHVRETGPKGCVEVVVAEDRSVSVDSHRLDVLQWEICRVDAAGAEAGYDAVDLVRAKLGALSADADGRPLAVRVEVVGECPAHRVLAAEPHRWTNEIRAAAADVGGDSLWIEKVRLQTSVPRELDPARWADGPLGELVCYLEEIKTDASQLASLAEVFADLQERLPSELREGPQAVQWDRPETLRGVMDEVEQLLIRHLLTRENAT